MHTGIYTPCLVLQQQVACRNSKFGRALVIETTPRSGSFVLGFRTDPESVLRDIQILIVKLHVTYAKEPEFGVRATKEDAVRLFSSIYVYFCVIIIIVTSRNQVTYVAVTQSNNVLRLKGIY